VFDFTGALAAACRCVLVVELYLDEKPQGRPRPKDLALRRGGGVALMRVPQALDCFYAAAPRVAIVFDSPRARAWALDSEGAPLHSRPRRVTDPQTSGLPRVADAPARKR